MNLYRHIDRTKIQFDFLYLIKSSSTYESEILELGGRVFYMEKPGLLTGKKFVDKVENLFKEHARDYAIIHLHEILVNTVCLGLAKKYGIKHRIAHVHSTRYSNKLINSFRNYFLCMTLKKYANHYFACSKAAGVFHFGGRQVYILRNATECDKFRYNQAVRDRIRKELKIENCFVVGHVGRLAKEKNHDFLLDIFNELRKREASAVLLLVGSGELEGDIKEKARCLGIDKRVVFLRDRPDVQDLLQGMDVFVFPSLFEGLPLTLIEAQASGLRCFSSANVTEEAKVTDLISYIPLRKSAAFWATEILRSQGYERRDAVSSVKKNGYDIPDVAKELENYYLDLIKMGVKQGF